MDIEYKKTYNSKEALVDSITKFKSETFQAIEESTYDAEMINASMIQLLRDVVDHKIHLPGNAEEFVLKGDVNYYKSVIENALGREDVGFSRC